MSDPAKQRYLTILLEDRDEVIVLTEAEYNEHVKDLGIDEYLQRTWDDAYADFVWQWAESPEVARSQHDAKIDAWHADPDQHTY